MKFTIVTVVYNNKFFLESTISSVIPLLDKSSLCEIEYLVVDGGSTDGTVDVIAKYYDMGVISRYISEKDSGIYDAMNKGIQMATGDWLIFMNAGDCFAYDDVLDYVAELIRTHNSINLIYGNYVCSGVNYNQELTIKYLMSHMLNHQSIFYHASLFKDNLYDSNYKFCADYKHLLSIYELVNSEHLNKCICLFDDQGISSSDENKYKIWIERVQAVWSSNLSLKCKILLSTRGFFAIPYQYTRSLILRIKNWL